MRLAKKNEAGLIADISRRTFFDTFAAHNSEENMNKFMSQQFSREMLMAEVGRPENIFLLASLNGETVGYAKMSESKKPPGLANDSAIEIIRIYAEQQSIGRGVGKALMEKCIEMAKEKNKKTIWLGVWEHNTTAILFYTKFGFTKFGTHIFMLGDDAQTDFLMMKGL